MKKSKLTKSNDMSKIIKMISRDEQFERNGGGQFVSSHKVHKSKKQYDRKNNKKELSRELGSSYCFYII